MKFRIALLQIAPFGSDQETNLSKGLQCCREAKAMGADMVVFPELWNIGFALEVLGPQARQYWIDSAIDQASNYVQSFAALAFDLDLNIAITYLQKHEPLPRNTVSIIDRGGNLVLTYSKVFVCDFGKEFARSPTPLSHDVGCDVHCSPGVSFEACTLVGAEATVCVGAMICADREFPEAATQLMLQGAELVVVPNACWWDDIRAAGLKTRAFENFAGMAMVNYPAPRNNGNSCAYTCAAWDENGKPRDSLIARAEEGERILIAPFEMDQIRSFRRSESWRLNY